MMTLFTQELLIPGFLAAGAFYPTLAHRPGVIDPYLAAVAKSAAAKFRVFLERSYPSAFAKLLAGEATRLPPRGR